MKTENHVCQGLHRLGWRLFTSWEGALAFDANVELCQNKLLGYETRGTLWLVVCAARASDMKLESHVCERLHRLGWILFTSWERALALDANAELCHNKLLRYETGGTLHYGWLFAQVI